MATPNPEDKWPAWMIAFFLVALAYHSGVGAVRELVAAVRSRRT